MSLDLDHTALGGVNVDVAALTHRLPAADETVCGERLIHSSGGKGANQAAAAHGWAHGWADGQ